MNTRNIKSLREPKETISDYYGFIYITTNNINGKQYIGQKKYYGNYENYLGSGIALKNAIAKYGKENFSREIIEECKTKEELDEQEKYWIKYYDATNSDNFYNITGGGDGGFGSGKNSPWYGKHLSKETKEKLSEAKKGKNNPFYGKTHTDEVKKKLSESSSKLRHSQETKDKISKHLKENHADVKGKNNPRAIQVDQFSLDGKFIARWDYAKEAAIALNICYSSIPACCAGRYKSAGGYIWKYSDHNYEEIIKKNRAERKRKKKEAKEVDNVL